MLAMFLFSEIEYLYIRDRLELNYTSEMEITFISDFRFMTYSHYIDMPKQVVEWNLIRKKQENPKFLRSLQKMPDPILDKYDIYIYSEDEDVDDIENIADLINMFVFYDMIDLVNVFVLEDICTSIIILHIK